jgi:hypothetical protein
MEVEKVKSWYVDIRDILNHAIFEGKSSERRVGIKLSRDLLCRPFFLGRQGMLGVLSRMVLGVERV